MKKQFGTSQGQTMLPVAKVLDWRDRWAELEASRNRFAVVRYEF